MKHMAFPMPDAAGLPPNQREHDGHDDGGAKNGALGDVLPPPKTEFNSHREHRQNKKPQPAQFSDKMFEPSHEPGLLAKLNFKGCASLQCLSARSTMKNAPATQVLCNSCALKKFCAGFARGDDLIWSQLAILQLARSLRWKPHTCGCISFVVRRGKQNTTNQHRRVQ